MDKSYINIGDEKMNLRQFINKVKNYDLELTRNDVFKVINVAEENNPSDIPVILDVIRNTYHLSIAY